MSDSERAPEEKSCWSDMEELALRFSFWRELVLYMLTHTNTKKTSEAFRQETLGLRGQGFNRIKIIVSLTKYSLGLYY